MLRIEAVVRREIETDLRETLRESGVSFEAYECETPEMATYVWVADAKTADMLSHVLTKNNHFGASSGKYFISTTDEVRKVRGNDIMSPLFSYYDLYPEYLDVLADLDYEMMEVRDSRAKELTDTTFTWSGGHAGAASPASSAA